MAAENPGLVMVKSADDAGDLDRLLADVIQYGASEVAEVCTVLKAVKGFKPKKTSFLVQVPNSLLPHLIRNWNVSQPGPRLVGDTLRANPPGLETFLTPQKRKSLLVYLTEEEPRQLVGTSLVPCADGTNCVGFCSCQDGERCFYF